jgi:hypothetical protein
VVLIALIIIAVIVDWRWSECIQIIANRNAKLAPMIRSKNITIPNCAENIKMGATLNSLNNHITRYAGERYHSRERTFSLRILPGNSGRGKPHKAQ